MRRQALGEGWDGERLPGDLLLVEQEVGAADVVRHQDSVLQQRHGVALQGVARGETAGGEGRGYATCRRGKRAAEGREVFSLTLEGGEARRRGLVTKSRRRPSRTTMMTRRIAVSPV